MAGWRIGNMHLDSATAWVIWNIGLATVPVISAQAMVAMAGMAKRYPVVKVPLVAMALVWLTFLPNTCYLLTEWRHFLETLDAGNLFMRSRIDRDTTIRLMKYTIFYFCYSGIGMLFFALSIRPVEKLVRTRGANMWIYGAALFLLMSAGVYLGLVMRFNSWDLINHPKDIWATVVNFTNRPKLTAFLLAFAGFLWLAYTVIDIWIDGFIDRLEAYRLIGS